MIRTVLFALGITLASGCASELRSREGVAQGAPSSDALPAWVASSRVRHEMCPLKVDDAKVGTEDVQLGAAVVFTTKDDIVKLRDDVASLSTPDSLRTAAAHPDNIDGGVRIVFVAGSAAQVPEVRKAVDTHASQLAEKCGLVVQRPDVPPASAKTTTKPSDEEATSSAPPDDASPSDDGSKEDEPGKSAESKVPEKPQKPAKPGKPEKPKPPGKPKEPKAPEKPKKPETPKKPDKPKGPVKPKATP